MQIYFFIICQDFFFCLFVFTVDRNFLIAHLENIRNACFAEAGVEAGRLNDKEEMGSTDY